MAERTAGIVETVKDTSTSLSKAVTGAVEAVTAYLTPTKRKPGVPKKRATAAPTRSKAAATPPRKRTTAKRSHAAASTRRPTAAPRRGKTVKPRATAKGDTAAQGQR